MPNELPGAIRSPAATLERADLPRLFQVLQARGYQIVGPTVRDGAIIYDTLANPDQLPASWLDASCVPVPGRFFYYSTHAFSVAEAIELARALGKLPPRVILYGIEGKDFAAGETLSPEVATAVDEVLGRVREEIQSTKI